ncbi:MAG TPA: uroporphyrinogen decarboxylase family protein [Anaerolineales bacterium]|nr:uroporphyrinogen decarboxylase family protein [Anaerolineales bacterium]
MTQSMTGRERMLTAFRRGKADTVPVSPDISAMVPVRLAGRPFDEMFLDNLPHNGYASASVAQAYVDAVKYYGMDGWYIYGSMREISPEDRPQWQSCLERLADGGQVKYETAQTPYGELTKKTLYPVSEPPWEQEKPVKDLRRDWPRLRSLMSEDGNWRWDKTFSDRERIGELGVYSVAIGIPQDWWFFQRHGGYNVMFYDYADDEAYIREIFEFYSRYALARVEAACAAGADEIMLGGSASSLSVSSPRNFRKFDLPFIQKAAEVCRRHGVFSHLHVCGRSRKVVEMVCEETDVDVTEPLEEPPGGDVDIAEIKRRYGNKICMKGNINTFEFMLRATPQQVEEKAKRLIDDCAADGGFILSTGDQCGRDTPDANLFKLVEVAREYGRYN